LLCFPLTACKYNTIFNPYIRSTVPQLSPYMMYHCHQKQNYLYF
jgi:hypothetical protein